MGARATKHQTGNTTDHGGNNLVTRFTISDESGPPLSIDQVLRAASKYCAFKKEFCTSCLFAVLGTSERVVEKGPHLMNNNLTLKFFSWWHRQDSNLGPTRFQACMHPLYQGVRYVIWHF